MVARSCEGYLMVMHETRIFYFEYVGNNVDDDTEAGHGRSSSVATTPAIDTVWAVLIIPKQQAM